MIDDPSEGLFRTPAPGEMPTAVVCTACGVLVVDKDAHVASPMHYPLRFVTGIAPADRANFDISEPQEDG